MEDRVVLSMRLGWFFALLLFVPPVEAGFSFDPPAVVGSPVAVGEEARVTTTATYACTALEANPRENELYLDISAPLGVTFVGPYTYKIPASACLGPASQPWRQDLTYTLTASNDAPGEKPLKAALHGRVWWIGGTAQPAEATVDIPFEVRYNGALVADIHPGKPQPSSSPYTRFYEIILTNLGNANTEVKFDFMEAPPPRWTVFFPIPTFLGTFGEFGGDSWVEIVPLAVIPPAGEENRKVDFSFIATSSSTLNPDEKGPPVFLNLTSSPSTCLGCDFSQILPTPAPTNPIALIALLLLATLVARHNAPRTRQGPER